MHLDPSTVSLLLNNLPNLIGLTVPFFMEFLNRDITSDSLRHILTVCACIIIAGLLHGTQFSVQSPWAFLGWVGLIFTESQTVFKLYFANSSMRALIQKGGMPSLSPSPSPSPAIPQAAG